MALVPPQDLSLHPVWNHAVYWAGLDADILTNEVVDPVFEQFKTKTVSELQLPYEFAEVPGLTIRRATPEDILLVADVLAKSGNIAPERAPRLLAQLVSDPFAWALMWELDGEPIQFEVTMLGPDETAYMGYLVHFSRGFAQWVWGACEVPVFKWLVERGYKKFRSLIRKNRTFRIPRLQKVYDVQQVGETPNFVRLEWDLAGKALAGFPERRTAGVGWEYTYKNVWFREMQDADLADVQEAIRAEFARANIRNGDTAAKMLADRWRLEKASVLLGYVNGTIRFVRVAREREGEQAAVATLNPLLVNSESRIVSYVSLMWLRLLGYKSGVMFVPANQYRSPKMVRYLDEVTSYMKVHSVNPHYDGPVYEVGIDNFDPVLKVKIEDWV